MKTPVLFLIYNRPAYTREVFEVIRKARPEKLFISADGRDSSKPEDDKLCKEARDIATQVDWPCEVHTLFSDHNLGCKSAIIAGINWFFEYVSEGIILEDDCLPNESFFTYCEILLGRHRDEPRVMMISGSNPATSVDAPHDYFFSHFYTIWGWATWKRAWEKFDVRMTNWPTLKHTDFLKKIFPNNTKNRLFTERMFDQVYGNDKSSVWSLQWIYACMSNDAFVILPRHNLISNIGLTGTHEMEDSQLSLKTTSFDFDNFSHPQELQADQHIEDLLFESSGLGKDV